jgi:hypothetical protein
MLDRAVLGSSVARSLDQFFTARDVAQDCFELAHHTASRRFSTPLWVEPSAGGGVFLNLMPLPRIGIDIAPQARGILRQDFLSWQPDDLSRPIIVCGNPPFGKNAALAIRFFNHAARFADLIAMIVPKTFQKASTHRRLDTWFHIVSEHPIRTHAFLHQQEIRDVPTVFQIWEKRSCARELVRSATCHPHFAFVKASEAEFAFQRVGARAGLVSRQGLIKSSQSHYFLSPRVRTIDVQAVLKAIDWSPVKSRTAGNPSIGKAELVEHYARAIA